MKSRTTLLLLVGILSTSLFCHAQYLDSIKVILSSKASDSIIQQKVLGIITVNKKDFSSLELAECYHEYGKWFYKNRQKKEGNLNEAIQYTQKSVVLKKANKVSEKSLKKSLYNLGYFYSKRGNTFEAIKYYQQIKDLSYVDRKTLYALNELANMYMINGDYQRSILNLDLLISESLKDSAFNKWTIQAYLTRAETYGAMDRQVFSKKIKSDIDKVSLLLDSYTGSSTSYYSRLYQIEGNRLLENNFPKEAIPYFHNGLKSLSNIDLHNKAIIYNSLGHSYFKLREYNIALDYFNKAIKCDSIYTPPYENIGDVYVARNEYKLGLKQYQKAINTLVVSELAITDTIENKSLELVTNKYYLLHHLTQKAKAWMGYYKATQSKKYLQYALQTFKVADQLIDIIRFQSIEYKSKLYWREQGASLYSGAVEVCYLLNKPKEAFYFMEKNKAILLLEDLSNYQAIENIKLPLALANKEMQLKNKINFLEAKLQYAFSTKEVLKDSLQRQLYLSKRRYSTFVDSLVVAYPEYGKYKREIPIITFKEAIEFSKVKEFFFLQYITTDTKAYGMLIGAQEPILFEIEKAEKLTNDIKKYQDVVAQKFVTVEEQQSFGLAANKLFKKLFPLEVYQQVKGHQVIIIPDYRLQEVSFETLTTSENPTDYLIKEAEISYAYSISHLENNNKVYRNSKAQFLAIAPVHFKALHLPTLQYTSIEANSLKNIFSGNVLLDEKATKTNFLTQAGSYKALHLATHAEVDGQTDPWIALSDSRLRLQELYSYKNEHELVTLSACKTSLGKIHLGEGVMSLARGFFYGGAKSVVSSVWATNDKANQQIMISFYQYLQQGKSKSKALQQAKLDYLKTHEGIEASPFYWGGNILIGDVATIDLTAPVFNKNWKLVTLCILLIFSMGLFFFSRKRKAKNRGITKF